MMTRDRAPSIVEPPGLTCWKVVNVLSCDPKIVLSEIVNFRYLVGREYRQEREIEVEPSKLQGGFGAVYRGFHAYREKSRALGEATLSAQGRVRDYWSSVAVVECWVAGGGRVVYGAGGPCDGCLVADRIVVKRIVPAEEFSESGLTGDGRVQ